MCGVSPYPAQHLFALPLYHWVPPQTLPTVGRLLPQQSVPKTILNFPKPCFQIVLGRVRVGSATRTRWVRGAYVLVFRRVRVSNLTRTRQLTSPYALHYRRVRVDLLVRTQFVRTAYVLCGMAAGWSRGTCMFPTFRTLGSNPCIRTVSAP